MITDRKLKDGTHLVARFKGKEYTCTVKETAEGTRYVHGGTEYRSPSGAGAAITGHASNGWAFFSLGGTEKPARKPRAPAAKAKKPTAKPSGRKPARKASKR
jgi:Protein of unknown function (DUF2924)